MKYFQEIWLKSYDEGVKPEIDIPEITLGDWFVKACKTYESKNCLYYMGTTMTFGELLEKSYKFAKGLQEKKFGKGDCVAVCLPNIPQYHIAIVGSLLAGCTVSGLSPLLMPDEIAYQLNDCKPSVLVMLDGLFDSKYMPLADKTTSIKTVLVAGAMDFIPNITEYPSGKPLSGKDVLSFMSFLEQHSASFAPVDVAPEAPCFIQYTGGTTGLPKGAVLTHKNMVADISIFKHYMKLESETGPWLSAFPMFHIAGLFFSNCAMISGVTQAVIPNPRDLNAIVDAIDALNPHVIGNVPSLSFMLMENDGFKNLDFSNLRYWISGAAPFPEDRIRELEQIIGPKKLVEVWGMTETCPMITVNPAQGKKKIGSVGLPISNILLKVVDVNEGKSEVPLGQEGELIISGPTVMQEYLNKENETRNTLRELDDRLWMYTGDVGRMDENGYVYIVDRAKDMINVGGYKVYSSEVEGKFYDHPAISVCALVGVPNLDRPDSEIVKLVVKKSEAWKNEADKKIREELILFAREKMASYKVPKIIEFMDELPTTSVGKVNKKSLRVNKANS
ncbi:Acyl-CoA synthetase (AMP-forming)/AMP-acid ligase II [Desulfocicer vacuolatum DSM 3385]|uniref:Acyl-CoA synthetase (AMP-forming)/AMP-acid ligase II n=1 Tax=Desulfocicer vacuolatum DSM 3385 TaxID=1121400 RepID=A0A1W2D4V2_9BACT|nr:AMP-binding protein [Desulfocicer vacuolatum]SMC92530.1 Acyl-CoA synthetase (AMP-forming)/AMP-acid ligase II [Desulfocicer vacuolatum DSM 3385]